MAWWQRLPVWAKWTIGVVGGFLLIVIGGAIAVGSNEEDSLKDEVATLEKQVEAADAKAEAAEARADVVEGKAAAIKGAARAEAANIVATARGELTKVNDSLGAAEGELASTEQALSETESELGGAEERVAKGTITDGIWKLEQDYLPGTYEAPGGGGCYWALRSSVGGGGIEDIIENGGFNKHQILTIESPYFETSDCGTWHLVE